MFDKSKYGPATAKTSNGDGREMEIIVLKEGQTIEGIFLGVQAAKGKMANDLLMFELESGEAIKLWSTALLDRAFSDVPIGSLCEITYHGMKDSRGGKQYHNFSVTAAPPIPGAATSDDNVPF